MTYEKFFKRSMAARPEPMQSKKERAYSADGASTKNTKLGKFLRPKIST